jgi:uncharacterized protein Yka (UPF0111/DUF47 family)
MEDELETTVSRLEDRVTTHHDEWVFMDIRHKDLKAILTYIRHLESEIDDLYRQAAYNN